MVCAPSIRRGKRARSPQPGLDLCQFAAGARWPARSPVASGLCKSVGYSSRNPCCKTGLRRMRTESLAAPPPRPGKRFSGARDRRPQTGSDPACSIKEIPRDSCSSTRLGTHRYSGDDSQSGCGTQSNTYSDRTRSQGASSDPGEGSLAGRLNGRQLYVWHAVDSEGEGPGHLVHPRRVRKAAAQADATTPEEAGRHSSHHRDRQARILQLCANLVLRGGTIQVAGRITGQRIPISHCDNGDDE